MVRNQNCTQDYQMHRQFYAQNKLCLGQVFYSLANHDKIRYVTVENGHQDRVKCSSFSADSECSLRVATRNQIFHCWLSY